MKRLLSLIIAVILISSVMMITTSAATPTDIYIGTNVYDATANANALRAGALSSNYSAKLIYNYAGSNVVFGTQGNTVTFYVNLKTLLPYYTYGDVVTPSLTASYSIVNQTAIIDTTVDPTGNTMKITLWAQNTAYQNAYVNLNFVHYKNYTMVNNLSVPFTVSGYNYYPNYSYGVGQTFYYDYALGGYYCNALYGSQLTYANIATAKGSSLTCDMGGGLYTIFPKVNNLSPVDLSANIRYSYTGINIPSNQMVIIDFKYPTTLGDSAKVRYDVGDNFVYQNGTNNINVYFIEDVDGASTTVKGARATYVGKASYAKGFYGEDYMEFNLLNGNRLGTYILTPKTLTSTGGATTGSTTTTTDGKNTVMNPLPQLPAHQNPPIKNNYVTVVPNVNTGADYSVTVAVVVATISLLLAGFVALKKVK